MTLSVSKRGLYLLAVVLWIFSGIKVLSIGIHAWLISQTNTQHYVWLVVALVFFSGIIFPPVARKNVAFVNKLDDGKHPIWKCFKPSSWGIMAVMMAFGIWLRLSGYVSDAFVAGFYCGLGASLLFISLYYVSALRKSFLN